MIIGMRTYLIYGEQSAAAVEFIERVQMVRLAVQIEVPKCLAQYGCRHDMLFTNRPSIVYCA